MSATKIGHTKEKNFGSLTFGTNTGLLEIRWKEVIRMTWSIFEYSVHLVRPLTTERDRRFRKAFPVEKRVAITLWRLAKGNSFRSAGKNFAIAKSTRLKKLQANFANTLVTALHGDRDGFWLLFPKTEKETPEVQKQPPEVFFKKRCFLEFYKIHRKTQEIAGLRAATLFKKRL